MSFVALKMHYVCKYVCLYGCACTYVWCMCMYVCMYVFPRICIYVCLYVCIPTHLKKHVVCPYTYNSCIGTVVVVKKRAVIERQSRVRLVVLENIIPKGQARRQKVFRQKQCPAPQDCIIFFESTPCKSSETSCLESRRKFDGVKFVRDRYSKRIVQIYRRKQTSPI